MSEPRVLTPTDDGFRAASRVWNAAVRARPAAIARCGNSAEVAAAVRAGREAGLPLSVRAGGHDWAGRAIRDGGFVIDLTGMRGVAVDPGRRVATVQGGAITADLLAAAAPYGLVTATGVVSGVGLAGLTTAGGYGPLIGRYGLALDNLIGAELVLADGSTVTAGPDDDPELWWAVRGGGGNLGVVTALSYRMHPLPALLTGMLMFPFAQAGAVLSGYAEIVAAAPDELTVMGGFLPGPDGRPLVFLCPFWCGDDLAAGERAVARLRSLGRPVVDQIGSMPYADALGMFDGSMVEGNHYLLRTRWFADVAKAVGPLVDAADAMSSPHSALILNRFHGAAARIDPAATAFAQRTPHVVAEVIAAYPPDEPPGRHRAWADAVVSALDPIALPGGYPNLLGPDDDERARASF
ncbi:MAG: FAD-binding oxidoreductase, partial [Actinoplanes sp.]